MKRLIATITVGVAVAGCGTATSQNTASTSPPQCAKWKAEAQTWAHNFVSGMPSASQAYVAQLAATAYQASAASHGWNCP